MTIHTTGHVAQRTSIVPGNETQSGRAYVLLGLVDNRERFVGIIGEDDDGTKHFVSLEGRVLLNVTAKHHFLPATLRVNVER